ncbi:MAG: TVP38/TMEM64 family protein [Candidatus Blackburnbacteria bacterium]|nr:TVP38/TMEM64 family protein [Candidatus Blackburnbacteria bacterium]
MPKSFKRILVFIFPIILTILLSYVLQALIVKNQEQFTNWLSSFGPYIIIVYIILQAITVVFAPLSGLFLLVAMIALFGPAVAITLAYLVTTPAYLANFYLSKKYGRPLAEKIVGQGALKKMDKFVANSGLGVLVVIRLFQSSNFDYLSYAFGLTNIPFKTFAVVNVLAGIPAALISYIIYSLSDNLTEGVVITYVVGVLFAGFSILLSIYLNNRKNLS